MANTSGIPLLITHLILVKYNTPTMLIKINKTINLNNLYLTISNSVSVSVYIG